MKRVTKIVGDKKPVRILIIEDDAFFAEIYRERLSRDGFTVLHAADGRTGLRLAERERPAVILLDVLIPKLDGFVVLERLKNTPATQAIPVIMLTNLSQKDDLDRAAKLGAADYLIKVQVTPSETVARIKKILKL